MDSSFPAHEGCRNIPIPFLFSTGITVGLVRGLLRGDWNAALRLKFSNQCDKCIFLWGTFAARFYDVTCACGLLKIVTAEIRS